MEGEKGAASEAGSPSGVAPTPTTALLWLEPCQIVIHVTPPSPPTTIRPSQSNKLVKSGVMNPENSRLVPEHPQAANSTSKSDRPRVTSQGAEMLASTRPVRNYSRPFKPDTDEAVGCGAGSSQHIAHFGPSKCTASKVVTSLIGREIDGHNAPVKGPVRRQAHTLASSFTSSLCEWGKAASRLLSARRPARREGNELPTHTSIPWKESSHREVPHQSRLTSLCRPIGSDDNLASPRPTYRTFTSN
ncbi:hypothetical protein M407DRAFT_10451 [Tulasnella calospora MUT 4182]|uniref:Uncharacterized protein n=1 Tax=Tulasnella calospora MUT 4182 TaxID=1051891 RepID=A0A0C3Q9K8_9AGAM|nr:hypothetical protein M407DRAFT_10451 [Tulasnella calospora MUT 4182]